MAVIAAHGFGQLHFGVFVLDLAVFNAFVDACKVVLARAVFHTCQAALELFVFALKLLQSSVFFLIRLANQVFFGAAAVALGRTEFFTIVWMVCIFVNRSITTILIGA